MTGLHDHPKRRKLMKYAGYGVQKVPMLFHPFAIIDGEETQQDENTNNAANALGEDSRSRMTAVSTESTEAQSGQRQSGTSFANSLQYQRLPKLTLTVFSGNIIEWQSFWDAYESTVHLNPNLSEVQKFNYLKNQLEGSAAQTIHGFALTNANYIQAINLLKERYRQKHKIVHTYMQTLLNIPAPSYTLHGLRNYIDKLESYIRGLESLGECQSNYGTLLVPVIIDKLPAEIRKNLAREHGSDNWQLDE
ncbi:uncharacterized protein LOC123533242 [Mercenaria mercenaria]|uniref:uncharacterized protein LOC123533242 n=1 Tax=Mercenaria mercenaria TaxID=6596 RepID=UPI00234F9BAA|nr:uncharacterized protein LOC123533242 [Mercenaria mercenaria]